MKKQELFAKLDQAALKIPGYKIWAGFQMIRATKRGDLSAVAKWLSRGANPNAKDFGDDTAMKMAAERGRADIVKVLAAAGADVNLPNLKKITPVMAATKGGHLEAVQALLALGAKTEGAPFFEGTIVEQAFASRKLEVLQLFFEQSPPSVRKCEDMYFQARKEGCQDIAFYLQRQMDKRNSPWRKVEDEKIIHITKTRAVDHELLRIFDFRREECFEVARNLRTGAESTIVKKFNEVAYKELLEEARVRIRGPAAAPVPAPVKQP